MRVFFDLQKASGLTWQDCLPGRQQPAPPVQGTPSEFAEAVAAFSPEALVSIDTCAKLRAIAKAVAAAGRPEPAAALLRVGQIDLASSLGEAKAPEGVLAIAELYLRGVGGNFGGVLPAGCLPSPEQWDIILAYERRANIVCQAVAGAGKSTTLILCAQRRRITRDEGQAPAKGSTACVLLTYNKRLQIELARRLAKLRQKPSLTPYTYHGAAGRSYGGGAIHNDELLRQAVKAAPENPLSFQVLMIDEAQDMTLEFYLFARHLLRANPGAQVIVVGDTRQAINEYRGARPEFLSEAEPLYAGLAADSGWVQRRLSISQRLTPATAAFVNTHLYGAQVVVGGNRHSPDSRPRYVTAKSKPAMAEALAREVKAAVETYGAEGVFVLAASVRNLHTTSQSPLADLVRRHLAGVPVFIAEDDAAVDAELVRGKLAILSFNAAKGCERPCVVAVGLDEGYFEYYFRDWADARSLPNVLTVAATRAIAQLVVVASTRTLRTVDVEQLSRTATLVGPPPRAPAVRAPKPRNRTTTVSDLTRHLHPETVREILAHVSLFPGSSTEEGVAKRAPMRKIRFGALVEDVGFAYGIIAPVLAELARTGETRFAEGISAPVVVPDGTEIAPYAAEITQAEWVAYPDSFWERIGAIAGRPHGDRSAADWGRLAVAHRAVYDGAHHLARQIDHYDWADRGVLDDARDLILGALGDTPGEFEVPLERVTIEGTTIYGRADFVDATGVIWEFKCVTELTEAHVLQLACYLAMHGGGLGVLFNAYTGERREVFMEAENAQRVLRIAVLKARPAAADIFSLIERYDREGAIDEPSAEAQAPSSSFGLDDVF